MQLQQLIKQYIKEILDVKKQDKEEKFEDELLINDPKFDEESVLVPNDIKKQVKKFLKY